MTFADRLQAVMRKWLVSRATGPGRPARIEDGRIIIDMSDADAAAAPAAVARALANYQAATAREHEKAVDRADRMLALLRQCLAEDHGDHRPACSPMGECFHGEIRELIAEIDGETP